jgi:hypothetical protein
MEIKIDFQLNHKFGVIEKMIFRFVLNGFKDATEISNALPIFSDVVIANGIRNLVNAQIITANFDNNALNLSDPIIAIINICHEIHYTVNVPSELEKQICDKGIVFSDNRNKITSDVKEAILQNILPNLKIDKYVRQYANTLDFIIKEYREE